MVAVPTRPTAVTSPLALTVRILGFDDANVRGFPLSAPPPLLRATALTCIVVPATSDVLVAVTEMVAIAVSGESSNGQPMLATNRATRASERMPVRDKVLRKLTERKFDMLFESPMAFDCRYMRKRTNAQDAKVPDFVLSPSRHTWPGRGHDEAVTW